MKKLILLSVMLFCLGSILSQEAKEIHFGGGYHYQYSQPLPNGEKDGKQVYTPYFLNKGQFNERGRIALDEKKNTFSIIWLNGDNWTADITKKEVVGKLTTFTGVFRDHLIECQLIIKDLDVFGCETNLNSKRVIDPKYGIDTYKHIYNFGTGGRCLIEQSEESKRLIEEAKEEKTSKEENEKLDKVKEEVFDKEKEKNFVPVEKMPEFPGGTTALMAYLSNNVKYPPLAKESGIQGRVIVNFTVEEDGSITNVHVVNRIGGGIDEEAIRVCEEMPKWSPGMQEGKPIRVSYNMPVNFYLQ